MHVCAEGKVYHHHLVERQHVGAQLGEPLLGRYVPVGVLGVVVALRRVRLQDAWVYPVGATTPRWSGRCRRCWRGGHRFLPLCGVRPASLGRSVLVRVRLKPLGGEDPVVVAVQELTHAVHHYRLRNRRRLVVPLRQAYTLGHETVGVWVT